MGLASPLGDALEDSWARLVAGRGAIGRLSFEGLPDIAAARVAGDVSLVLSRLQQVGTERVSQLALAAVRRALAAQAERFDHAVSDSPRVQTRSRASALIALAWRFS